MTPFFHVGEEMKFKLIFALFFFFFASLVFGVEIKFIEKIKLSQEKTIIQGSISFGVAEDELFLITDYKAADIKIYNKQGNLEKVWGRKGPGPKEFLRPAVCSYRDGTFAVLDFGKYRLFLFERDGRTDLKIKKEIVLIDLGLDFSLMKNELLVAGYKVDPNGKPYSLYILNLKTNKYTFLMPSEIKYGLNSFTEYKAQYRSKPELGSIGARGFCDWQSEYAYYIWEGNLRIIKINMKSGKIKFFGKKTQDYIQPTATKALIKANRERNTKSIFKEKYKMSYIKAIFVNEKYVGLLYNKPAENRGDDWDIYDAEFQYMFQLYTLDGKFIKEISISGKYYEMYMTRNGNSLYFLSSKFDEKKEEKEFYEILKYKIVE